jgi:hypothetical protein
VRHCYLCFCCCSVSAWQDVIIAGVTQAPGLPPWLDSHSVLSQPQQGLLLIMSTPFWQARLTYPLLLCAGVTAQAELTPWQQMERLVTANRPLLAILTIH